jgi:hypothetical protein
MTKLLTAALLLSVFFYSCKTDFDITADWQDITIAYGLLDPTDSAQYIKVNKAFLDQTTSALVIAKIADSLYYQNLNVELQQYKNGSLQQTIPLEKVDGNLEGYVKDSGIFSNAPNFLYKTKEPLDQSSSYTLLITESDNGKVISSSSEVINDFSVLRPTPLTKVNFFPGAQYSVQWNSATDGKIYALTIRFYYLEVNAIDTTINQEKYVDWPVFTSIRSSSTIGGQLMESKIPGDAFYSYINSHIPEDPSVYRVAGHFDFFFSVGGEELDTYNQVTIAQQGLTTGSVQPEYTNIDNGLGLFSSRFHKNILNVPIDGHTIDTLACSDATKHLRFENTVGDFCF